jgi:signal transduction histidine kinase
VPAPDDSSLVRLMDEQAALRRVATLVARGAPPADVFHAVAEELGQLLDVASSGLVRYEDAEVARVVAGWGRLGEIVPVGARLPLGGNNVVSRIARTGQAARVDDYGRTASGTIGDRAQELNTRTSIGGPVRVAGRLWGAVIASTVGDDGLPPDAEERLTQFSELVSTAIGNAEARAELQRLADEQAALRRVATLVAEAAAPAEVFDAVVAEVAQLLDAAQVGLMRAETPNEITILANRGQSPTLVHAGMRLPLDGESVTARVVRTGRSARLNRYGEQSGTIAGIAERSRVSATVGAPVTVDGRLWGAITASWEGEELAPGDAEERLAQFARLLETAIANADSRNQLTASRARVLTAGDEARRRLVRDLHDGAQQRLVHAIVTLKLAQRALGKDDEKAAALLAEAIDHAEKGNAELRELAHGILPAVLTHGGLRGAVNAVTSRLDLPVATEVTRERLPQELEASAYFIVAEALTNVVKHARADSAQVTVCVEDAALHIEVRDDGVGDADPEGHGLLGIGDRVAALGGRLRVDSPRGGGTVVIADLPLT